MLTDVLAGMERDYGIRIVLDREAVAADRPVADPAGLPPEAAIRKALQGFDYFFYYAPKEETGGEELKRVWVFSRGRGEGVQVMAEPVFLSSGLASPDPQQRAAAVHKLAEQEDADPVDAVTRSLADEDENVRQQALIAAQANGLSVPPETLESLLSADPSESVRILALEAVSLSSDIDPNRMLSILGRAVYDSSPEVKERAAILLRQHSPFNFPSDASMDSTP